MRFDEGMIQNAQRYSFKLLKDPTKFKQSNLFKTAAKNITTPAVLIQELPFVNTVNNYEFQFSASSAPKPDANLNNNNLGENDVFACYGIQVMIGTPSPNISPLVVKRLYNTRGFVVGDYALYTGNMNLQIETNTPVAKISMFNFLDARNANVYDIDSNAGLTLINPQRILTGRLSNILISIKMNPITTNVLTPNAVISLRLHGALGQASF